MLKKISAGLAGLALAAGLGVASTQIANADETEAPVLTEMGKELCLQEDGTPIRRCSIAVGDGAGHVNEGDTVQVTVHGVPGAKVSIVLVRNDSKLSQVGEVVDITVGEAGPLGEGEVVVDYKVPVLTGSFEGGPHYAMVLADEATVGDNENPAGRAVIFSNRASVYSSVGNGTAELPFRLGLEGGFEGHQFSAEALVDGKWIPFTTAEGNGTIDAEGRTTALLISPKVEIGRYPVRLVNLTTKTTGAEDAYTLYFGIDPDEGDDDGDDKGGDDGKDDDKDKDKPKDDDKGKGDDKDKGKDKGGKPGLPKTGVNA